MESCNFWNKMHKVDLFLNQTNGKKVVIFLNLSKYRFRAFQCENRGQNNHKNTQ